MNGLDAVPPPVAARGVRAGELVGPQRVGHAEGRQDRPYRRALQTKRKEAEMTREDYVRKMHVLLDELNAEIDVVTKRAENAGADVRDELAELRARQDEAGTRLASLRESGEGAWQDLKAGVDLARDAVGEALESARSRFRQ